MTDFSQIDQMHSDLIALRRDIHAHPETAFEENRTAQIVAEKLEEFGLEVATGIGKTGVVGSLKCGSGNRAFAFRADMDALFIEEENDFAYKSTNKGKMHACGHDGHTTMLLGAAKVLAHEKSFDGTLHFIFQPAEETVSGAPAMAADGLYKNFPVEAVYGMHNMPGRDVGTFAVRKGALFGSLDVFEMKVRGVRAHPATQHLSPDVLLVTIQIVNAWQGIKAVPAVVGVTQMQAGDPYNEPEAVHISPDVVFVRGDVICFGAPERDKIERELKAIAESLCSAHGLTCEFTYNRYSPEMINTPLETDTAVSVAKSLVGDKNVIDGCEPILAAEDFAYLLEEWGGCYILIGNGKGEQNKGGCMIHNPGYDFNDDIIPLGVKYWVELAETLMPEENPVAAE
ncbi:MAG TPA: amidohydrolase [Sneathiellales bacterium]|nr:amidohydrolase [Sneathiellales bacterium]